ncbi:hypothetical protein GALL_451070 [mine drainage metagenome]|uniref:Uncharacterized protein n=1 Tax=mine drainage metagenome TaxID=410659 RepID=A0A1J5Q702_9ZZZZ
MGFLTGSPGQEVIVVVGGRDARCHDQSEQHAQRAQSAVAIGFADGACFRRQGGRPLRPDQGDADDVDEIERGQGETRNERTLVHIAHAAAELVGHDDEHQRGRDDLRQRARGSDHPRGHPPVIAVAQHDGQRDQSHGNDRRRDHAGGCRQHGTDQHHGDRQSAADGAEQLADGFQQIFGHAAAFQQQAHEGEERDGQQGVVLHDADDAQRNGFEQRLRHQAEFHADEAEQQAAGGQAERHRKADQEEHHQHPEHDGGDIRDEEGGHYFASLVCCARTNSASSSSAVFSFFLTIGSSIRPRKKAMRLISSDRPCSPSSEKPMGTRT